MVKGNAFLNKLLRARDNKELKFIRGSKLSGKTTMLKMLEKELADDPLERKTVFINPESFKAFRDAVLSDEGYISNGAFLLIDDFDCSTIDRSFIFSIILKNNRISAYAAVKSMDWMVASKENGIPKYTVYPLYPLPFSEYKQMTAPQSTGMKNIFLRYAGSIPSYRYLFAGNSRAIGFSYFVDSIQAFCNAALKHYGTSHPDSESLFSFIAKNTGRILSCKDIAYMTKISPEEVRKLIFLLEDMNILASLKGYDEKNDDLLKEGKKYYIADNCIYSHYNRKSNPDMMVENLVAIELIRNYDYIYYGLDVDFVTFSEGQKFIFILNPDKEELQERIDDIRSADGKKIIIADKADSFKYKDIECIKTMRFFAGKYNKETG